jgi:subtilisin family serine protease
LRHPSRVVKAQLPRAGMLWLLAVLLLSTVATSASSVSDKLAGPLRALAAGSPGGVVSSAAVANLVHVENGLVQVELLFRTEVAAATTDIAAYGGKTEIRMDRRVQAQLPPATLNTVAQLPQVVQVRVPNRVWPLQGFGATGSEGVQMTLATAMHANGVLGEGAKVAVIDTGFTGYATAEIPGVVDGERTREFGSATLAGGTHGTAVAEVVADMAPAAEIWLLAVDTELAFEQAVEFVRDNDFDIAVASLGIFGGPYDGTHPVSRKLTAAPRVLWVIAAGNHARRHYEGTWTDRNHDTFHEWAMGDADLNVELAPGRFVAYLSWFQTAGSVTSRDYDLVLFDANGREVTRSAVTQKGDSPPSETLLAYIEEAGVYSLRIQRMFADASMANDHFKLFLPEVDIESSLQVPERSLTIPAESPGAFTIGAVRGSSVEYPELPILQVDEIEEFSSRGPSVAGLVKPDLVGPNVVRTAVAELNPFIGTSAAAPHVAGAAALLLSEDSTRSAGTLADMLKRLAVTDRLARDPSGRAIPDNTYGHGRVCLRVGVDSTPPVISISFPRNGTTITDATPTIIATITDVGVGVDSSTIQVRIDGNAMAFEYNPNTGLLACRITADAPLTRSSHTLTIDVSDYDGNAARTATSSFRVSTPSLDAGLHLIGLPYAGLANAEPSDVFGLPYEQIQMARWVPSDARDIKYHIYPDQYASFNPPDASGSNPLVNQAPIGLGYFVRLPNRCTISSAGGALTDADSYEIELKHGDGEYRGWNMIANPFEGSVDWGTVTFIADGQRYDLREAMSEDVGITEGVLFSFVSTATGGYYQFAPDPADAVMEFMGGYWLHVLRDATLVVYNPAVGVAGGTSQVQPAAAKRVGTDGEWLVQLSASSGEYLDPANYFGVHPQATEGYDLGLDISKPPALVRELSLCLLQRAGTGGTGRYAQDVRSSLGGRQEWDVEVCSTLSQVPVTLTWEDLNLTVPHNVTLTLRDVEAGREIFMRTVTSYTYRTGDGPETRRFKLVATVDQANSLAVSGLNTAAAADGTVSITYTVSRAATVTADIRNIAGVPIARLAAADSAAGATQTLSWNGRNASGARVPNGRYLVRLTARTAEGQSVQAITLFDKAR